MARYRAGWGFKRGNADGPPETYTTVTQVDNVDGLGVTNNPITGSDWDDDNNEFVLSGRSSGDDISLTLNYDHNDTEHQFLIAQCDANANGNIQVTQSQGTPKTWTGNVAYLGYKIATNKDEVNQLTITMKVNGALIQS